MTTVMLWLLRGLWIALPAALGPSLADAVEARSAAVAVVIEVLLWLGWGIGLVAVFVPRTVSLTVVRILAPLALVAAAWGAASGGVAGRDVVAVVVATAVVVVAMAPQIGERFVDGSSYGPERRLPLRPPAALLFGPIQLATAVVGAGVAVGPLLLAARQWVVGAVLLVVGPPLAAMAVRSLHGLSRRWLVLVPGGLVLHDPLTLSDPVLLPRESLVSVAPAEAGTEALDLTQRAPGLAVEIALAEPARIVLARPRRGGDEIVEAEALLVTPSRPAELIREVHDRI